MPISTSECARRAAAFECIYFSLFRSARRRLIASLRPRFHVVSSKFIGSHARRAGAAIKLAARFKGRAGAEAWQIDRWPAVGPATPNATSATFR